MADPLTIATFALTVGSGIAGAAGEARADTFKAAEAAKAARAGKIAAAETDTSLREELRSVLGNIRAIRVSAGISPDSPTTAAILEAETTAADRQRRIQVANILRQSESDEESSRFLKKSAQDKMLFGTVGAFGAGFSGLSRAG